MRQPKSAPRASPRKRKTEAGPREETATAIEGEILVRDLPAMPSNGQKPLSARDISALTDGVIEALTAAGGADYLLAIAKEDPKTFCALLAKVLPQRLDAKPQTGFILAWQNEPETPAAPDRAVRR